MKNLKLIILIVLFTIGLISKGQITLEHTSIYGLTPINTHLKTLWYVVDPENNQLIIYNESIR